MIANVDDFSLQVATFEARYAAGFLHWDKAGTIWHEMASLYPDLKNVQAQPGITSFRLGDNHELVVELNKLTVRAFGVTDSLRFMGELSDRLVAICATQLKINSFERLGLRTIHHKDCETLAAADEQVFSAGLLHLPESVPFIGEGNPTTGVRHRSGSQAARRACQ
jgi:hypothetical protein